MKKLLILLSFTTLALCGFAQTLLTTAMSQKELAEAYTIDGGVLTRTIEIPVKYGDYNLAQEDELFTRMVVFNYLMERNKKYRYFDASKSNSREKNYYDNTHDKNYINKQYYEQGYYNEPYETYLGFDCGKVSQGDNIIITTRPGFVICTVQVQNYHKGGGVISSGKSINPLTVYPYTDKDKKWAAEAFVSNYNQCEAILGLLFEEPLNLKEPITPSEVKNMVIEDKEKRYKNNGY